MPSGAFVGAVVALGIVGRNGDGLLAALALSALEETSVTDWANAGKVMIAKTTTKTVAVVNADFPGFIGTALRRNLAGWEVVFIWICAFYGSQFRSRSPGPNSVWKKPAGFASPD
jgi:hypothetical protein